MAKNDQHTSEKVALWNKRFGEKMTSLQPYRFSLNI